MTCVDVSALNQGRSAHTLKNTTESHVSVLAQTDRKPVPTLRLLIMQLANVAVLTSSNVLEDKSSIQIPVNVNVLNPGQNALLHITSTMLHASAFVQVDRKPVPTLRLSIMQLANAAVLTSSIVLEDKSSTKLPVNVSAPNLDLNAPLLSHMMRSHVSVRVQIDHRLAPTNKFLTMTSVYADALR